MFTYYYDFRTQYCHDGDIVLVEEKARRLEKVSRRNHVYQTGHDRTEPPHTPLCTEHCLVPFLLLSFNPLHAAASQASGCAHYVEVWVQEAFG